MKAASATINNKASFSTSNTNGSNRKNSNTMKKVLPNSLSASNINSAVNAAAHVPINFYPPFGLPNTLPKTNIRTTSSNSKKNNNSTTNNNINKNTTTTSTTAAAASTSSTPLWSSQAIAQNKMVMSLLPTEAEINSALLSSKLELTKKYEQLSLLKNQQQQLKKLATANSKTNGNENSSDSNTKKSSNKQGKSLFSHEKSEMDEEEEIDIVSDDGLDDFR